MLIGGILLGLVLGLLAGGRLRNLAEIQLRWTGLLVAAVVLRFATEWALGAGIDIVEMFRLPLLTAAFVVLLAALWINRSYPGLSLAFLGVLSNTLVIVANNGFMPIWQPALVAVNVPGGEIDRERGTASWHHPGTGLEPCATTAAMPARSGHGRAWARACR